MIVRKGIDQITWNMVANRNLDCAYEVIFGNLRTLKKNKKTSQIQSNKLKKFLFLTPKGPLCLQAQMA